MKKGDQVIRPIRGEFGETLTCNDDGNTEPSIEPFL